jgi:anaerobic selenocysteine-containing dehydrogenase
MDFAAALEDPARARALFVWNMNPLASCPQQARLRRALQREDLLTIALDLFPTDTTAMADYVLPAASFLEFDDLIASYFQLTLSAQVKAMEPMGSALPNLEIFRRLARAMNYSDPELQESDAAILDTLMERSGLGMTFAALAERGSIWIPQQPAARAAADGYPPLPQPWNDARPGEGRLRLLSPAHAWLMNTSFGNVRQIEHRLGEATIALHPSDAAERRLAQGDTALVHNSCGRLGLKVVISDQVPRGVALAHKGRWLSTDAASANVNVLNPGNKSDMGESTAVHSVEVSVAPFPAQDQYARGRGRP